MADNVTLSKTLSLWLRHKPDLAGLTLDAQGWAPTDAVLAALADQHGADFERLMDVVEHNDKQRFEFSPDLTLIRARQGHSVEVALDLAAATPPALLFHGTVARFLPAIRRDGLLKMKRHHVHLSATRDTAEKVGARRGQAIILVVDAAGMANAGCTFHVTANGVWLTQAVAPHFIAFPDER